MNISVQADVREVERMLGRIGRDIVPRGAERALNNVAWAARTDLQKHMQQVFDRPTKFTLNAPYVEKAGRNHLTATVTLQGKFINEIEKSFLAAQVLGGARKPKRMEQLLRSRGLIGNDEFLVPSKFQPGRLRQRAARLCRSMATCRRTSTPGKHAHRRRARRKEKGNTSSPARVSAARLRHLAAHRRRQRRSAFVVTRAPVPQAPGVRGLVNAPSSKNGRANSSAPFPKISKL